MSPDPSEDRALTTGVELRVDPEALRTLSSGPGVYLFKNEARDVLYVGKAKSLRARVRSYLGRDAGKGLKTRELVRRAVWVETIAVGSEREALILEANLIKEHHPRFNIQLRDDKSYPYIKVTVKEPFPRVFVTRRTVADGSRYFGPHTSVRLIRQALAVVKRLYTVRSCRYDLPVDTPSRPCLDYHIGRCKAPCVGLQTETDYRSMIDEIIRVLEGKTEQVRADVEARMRLAAEAQEFEQAARHRDVLQGLDALALEQRVERFGGGDVDVLGLARDGALAVGVVLRIRRGMMLGRVTQRFSDLEEESDEQLVASLALRHYLGRGTEGASDDPRDVLVSTTFPDRSQLAEVLSERSGRKVQVRVPERGEKRRLLELAHHNARQALEDRVLQLDQGVDRADRTLYDVQECLDLKVVPRLMMCFDISHLQGAETVGSAVVFENGEPKKSEYRRMRIQGNWGNDDYRSMREAVLRALRRRRAEDRPLPDLVLIDGGKGQLGAAQEALLELGMSDIAIAALAKREEEVFLPNRSTPVILDRGQRALHVLQRMRNEAHRFAVSYNRTLRRKRTLTSDLGDVPGIGSKKQRVLLERFGSVRGIRAASEEELARVPGISHALASRILTYLGRT